MFQHIFNHQYTRQINSFKIKSFLISYMIRVCPWGLQFRLGGEHQFMIGYVQFSLSFFKCITYYNNFKSFSWKNYLLFFFQRIFIKIIFFTVFIFKKHIAINSKQIPTNSKMIFSLFNKFSKIVFELRTFMYFPTYIM